MEKSHVALLPLVVCVMFLFPIIFNGGLLMVNAETEGTIADESWGYVEVRPGAQMFWWLYTSQLRHQYSSKSWPIILWLQGGPGSSGTGVGNFQEIGLLDTYLMPRDSTWLNVADLLFVDSPVGTGYSYVEDESLLVTTDQEAAADLTKLLIEVFNKNESLQESPLYIVGESYGGKHAVILGLLALEAIKDGELKAKFGGVVLGDSWISPEDFTSWWAPLLNDMSRLDNNCLDTSNSLANQIKQHIWDNQSLNALASWLDFGNFIDNNSNDVSFYNFMLDDWIDPLSYFSNHPREINNLTELMNSKIKKKLQIIPQNHTWVPFSGLVFNASAADFMRPRIYQVDELLSEGVDVTIYNGQLDVLCSTKGTETWVQRLKWDGLTNFWKQSRTPIYYNVTRGFTKSYYNLRFYWILDAGHYVPLEQPYVALSMIANITQSPAADKYKEFI